MADLELSLVAAAYDMPRQLARTVRSLSPAMQRGVEAADYELIVVDNGSSLPPDKDACEAFGARLRWMRIEDAPPSPARALNLGIAAAEGALVGAMVDGARLASPGLLAGAIAAARLHPRPVVATVGFHLGREPQQLAVSRGYDEEDEAALLEQADWTEDGYRLFEVAAPGMSAGTGWFDPPAESNALFMPARQWAELGGFDEAFAAPGGGLVNLDLFARACALPAARLVMLLGEGTFHQVHGGVSSNSPVGRFAEFHDEYVRLRGRDYARPAVEPLYWGEPAPDVFPVVAGGR